MSVLSIVLIVVAVMIVMTTVAIVFFRLLGHRDVKPCYRCGVLATTDYMGLHYCLMCRVMVVQMLQAVRHDPPFGFPGGPGYLDWPKELTEELKKKEGEKNG